MTLVQIIALIVCIPLLIVAVKGVMPVIRDTIEDERELKRHTGEVK